MNYCILNGVKSNTINGLMIQALPLISKPRQRTEIEEVDGRDGDIVTKLGYSAYNKEMKVGLYGDFEIDDVIQYFDSEGTVTFSNEPDKYYKYEIVEQIDFERLIRFRQATVTFHVQPFKYSAVENDFTFTNNYVTATAYSATKNGVTLAVTDGQISVSGTPLVATEFYVPIVNQAIPQTSNYSLVATAQGTGAQNGAVRLITTTPDDAHSFGGAYLALQNNATVQLNGVIGQGSVYGYLWFYFNKGTAMNFTLDVALMNNNYNSVSIRNVGNIYSRPKITIYGNGTVNLSINGYQVFVINLSDYVTIDAEQMNAYKGTQLMNRAVTGDYDNLILQVGNNTISWNGNVTGIDVENFTRWI